MEITEVQLTPIKPKDGLVAFASVVIDNNLYLGSIGVYARLNGKGYRITYPKKLTANKDLDIYHPINRVAGQLIEKAITNKATQLLT